MGIPLAVLICSHTSKVNLTGYEPSSRFRQGMEMSDRTIMNKEAGCVAAVHPVIFISDQKMMASFTFQDLV